MRNVYVVGTHSEEALREQGQKRYAQDHEVTTLHFHSSFEPCFSHKHVYIPTDLFNKEASPNV